MMSKKKININIRIKKEKIFNEINRVKAISFQIVYNFFK